MKKPRILHYYSSSTQIGGPLTYINTILNSDLNKVYELKACYQGMGPNGINLSLLNRMRAEIENFSPDLLHVHGLQSEGLYGLLAGRLAGCKKILVTVHGLASDTVEMNKVKKVLYRHVVEPFTLRNVDFVYCVCNHACDRPIIRKNARKLLGTVHTGISPVSPTKDKTQTRNELGLPPTRLMAIMVGRIVRDKGYGELSDVIHNLYESGEDRIRFCFVGQGGYANELSQKLEKEIAAGYVRLLGRRDDVQDLLAASDFFILPSWHENFPISLLEAALAGLPAIATRVGGIPEMIDHGRTGLLIHKNNPIELTSAINRFIANPDRVSMMGKNAKAKAQSCFSLSAMTAKIQTTYSQILG